MWSLKNLKAGHWQTSVSLKLVKLDRFLHPLQDCILRPNFPDRHLSRPIHQQHAKFRDVQKGSVSGFCISHVLSRFWAALLAFWVRKDLFLSLSHQHRGVQSQFQWHQLAWHPAHAHSRWIPQSVNDKQYCAQDPKPELRNTKHSSVQFKFDFKDCSSTASGRN